MMPDGEFCGLDNDNLLSGVDVWDVYEDAV